MRILAIETSCDETAVSIVECTGDISPASPDNAISFKVVGEALFSQASLHAQYGGVFPTLAKREHAKNLVPLLKTALGQSKAAAGNNVAEKTRDPLSAEEISYITKLCDREPELVRAITEELFPAGATISIPNIDLIAVTQGPGLEPALWVGINFAKVLQKIWGIPAIGSNHMEGHIASALATGAPSVFPAIALLISGGHTEIVLAKKMADYEIVGQTRDDAVGEAYDKVSRILGLGYPGGPEVARLAQEVRDERASSGTTASPDGKPLPRPMISTDDLDFSFSGLKTAVLYRARDIEKTQAADPAQKNDNWKKELAFEFEEAVADVLVKKTVKAIEKYEAQTLVIGGGVIANAYLRSRFEDLSNRVKVKVPVLSLATDNATMIAFAAYISMLTHTEKPLIDGSKAEGNMTWETAKNLDK